MATSSKRALDLLLCVLPGLIATGCVSPQSVLQERRKKIETQAMQILHEEYRLPSAPVSDLKVQKVKASAPGKFRMVVKAPGWEADAPLESVEIHRQADPSETVFTWELPAKRVSNWLDGKDAKPHFLLHLWKGQDHRPVTIPSLVTSGRSGEWAGMILFGGVAIVTTPVWLPSWLIITPVETSRISKKLADVKWPLPGTEAPMCYPESPVDFSSHLGTDPQGKHVLVIAIGRTQWSPCEGTALESMRRAIGCFQPELAAGIMEDPEQPNTFIVPLAPGEPNMARPILLVHRDCTAGKPQGQLWAFYFSSKGDWAKAWRLYEGPSRQADDPTAGSRPAAGASAIH